jgi:hypothetical protein
MYHCRTGDKVVNCRILIHLFSNHPVFRAGQANSLLPSLISHMKSNLSASYRCPNYYLLPHGETSIIRRCLLPPPPLRAWGPNLFTQRGSHAGSDWAPLSPLLLSDDTRQVSKVGERACPSWFQRSENCLRGTVTWACRLSFSPCCRFHENNGWTAALPLDRNKVRRVVEKRYDLLERRSRCQVSSLRPENEPLDSCAVCPSQCFFVLAISNLDPSPTSGSSVSPCIYW